MASANSPFAMPEKKHTMQQPSNNRFDNKKLVSQGKEKTQTSQGNVTIGQMDVIIQTPVEANKSVTATTQSADLANRLYLRRL